MSVFSFPTIALLLAAALCASSSAEAQENQEGKKTPIEVAVERVNVGVVVTDRNGHFVEGLRREDFRVLDNGIEQPINGFTAIEEPGQVLLLIEAGPAVYLLESGHVWAANTLLDGLAADDRVAVVKYADSPATLLDFTADKRAVDAAFGQLRFNLGFGSLNLSSSVSKVLEWLANVTGKKTIVLLSTGVDTSSSNEAALLMQQLKVSDVRLLAVSLAGGLQNTQSRSKKKSATKDSGETAQQLEQAGLLLRQIAESTGGRAYFPASAKEFDSVYAEIAQLIRHEYSLAFAPTIRDAQIHSIEIRVNAPQTPASSKQAAGYRVDHRQAYIAPATR
ncbi:MAG TPA: VWA domain-containing protein [Candidatus Acidoferrum sp.]|nr:VWA domain-containing protein [Candidatus Acidoferrum sp.]